MILSKHACDRAVNSNTRGATPWITSMYTAENAGANVHFIDQATDASAVLNADAKRGSCGHSSNRQCSKCWSTSAADSSLFRPSTPTKDVAISGQAHVIDKLVLGNQASTAVLKCISSPFVLHAHGTVNMAVCCYDPDPTTFSLQ